jgi:hypothetical protein
MDMRLWVAARLIATIVLSGTAFGQVKSDGPVQLRPCSDAHRSGRRIVSILEIVEFYVPRFAKIKRVADVDYVEYYVRYGPERDKLWLKFMFGGQVGGVSPQDLGNTSIKWTAQKWGCHGEDDGTDWSSIGPDGRRWRHIAIPFGFATYQNASPKAADYFDKILDTMCCLKCTYCKK